jgi:Animal haem peroxidase
MGVEIIPSEEEPGVVELVVPLNVAFFNPDLVGLLELGPLLQGIGLEAQYKNDEQIDNQLRSVLFQVPVSGNPGCLDGPELPECFEGVVDLGAIDIERGRDHGMPTYNQLRNAFGLPSRTSFRAVTGEATELFPADPELTPGDEINDPNSLDFVRLIGRDGQDIPLDSEEAESSAVQGLRRTSTAARLRAVYGSVGNLDAFTGMISEPHVAGTEFGELQLAMWRRQFQALRDGDRFFYGNDPNLNFIRLVYGIDFRRSLGDIIALNTDIPRNELEPNVFLAPVD